MGNNDTTTTTTAPIFEPTTSEGEPNDNNSWRSSARQCVWPQVICREGFVVSLQLSNAEGSIANEIGLLTGLNNLKLEENGFTGIIPSEIGLLKGLNNLDLEENGFTGII